MRVIYKYKLAVTDVQTVKLPKGYKIVHVDESHGDIYIWCELNQLDELEEVRFDIHGTGHIIMKEDSVHLASVVTKAGYVWHVYHYPA